MMEGTARNISLRVLEQVSGKVKYTYEVEEESFTNPGLEREGQLTSQKSGILNLHGRS